MGCGDHWPKCNGRWFPPLDRPDLIIEITHRWIALALLVAIGALLFAAWRARSNDTGRGGTAATVSDARSLLRISVLATVLWIAPAILGAVTVWFALPPLVVVVHLALAMILLAVLVVAVVRAGGFGADSLAGEPMSARTLRGARIAMWMGFLTL